MNKGKGYLVAVAVIDAYLVVMGLQWALNGGGGIGLALAAAAGMTGFAALGALKG